MKRIGFVAVFLACAVVSQVGSLAQGSHQAWSWGDNAYGQLGDGVPSYRDLPVKVLTVTGATALAGGYSHSLALKGDGTVWAWGDNGYGQLGNGTNTDSAVPVQISGLTGITSAAAGYYHSLALKGDGTLWAWGDNQFGQLGDGTNTASAAPVQVSGLTAITSVAAGGITPSPSRTTGRSGRGDTTPTASSGTERRSPARFPSRFQA